MQPKTVILVFLLATFFSVLFFAKSSQVLNFLERTRPSAEIKFMPAGLGILPVNIELELSDLESGLSEVILRIAQRGKFTDLVKIKLEKQRKYILSKEIDASALNLSPGPVTLEIKAFDSAYFQNEFTQVWNLIADFQRPVVTPISIMHNVFPGGSSLVLYQASDLNLKNSGVVAGGLRYQGFPIRNFDPQFRSKNTYLTFYVQPFEESPVKLFAEDLGGNAVEADFNYSVVKRGFSNLKIRLGDQYFDQLSPILEANQARLKPLQISGEALESFKNLENLDFADLQALARQASATKYFQGPFQPAAGTVLAGFGDQLNFETGNERWSNPSPGYYFQTQPGVNVFTLNNGEVIYSGDLGIFGRTVMVSHGIGLVSVYYGLSKTLVLKGDSVISGSSIGITGQTGRLWKNGYGFILLIQGTPVEPRLFWDKKWFHEHIQEKLVAIKRNLAIPLR